MSKSCSSLILLLLIALTGCGVRPAPGTSAVLITLSAEPKVGAKMASPSADGNVGEYVGSAAPTGRMEQIDYANLSDIIVWLEPESASATTPPRPMKIDPTTKLAGVQPISVGQGLVFHNSGEKPVSVYSVSDGNEFDVRAIAPGQSASFSVHNPGLIEILTEPKRPPVAVLYAVPSPWVARGQSGEKITFSNIPPGRYRACAWHPRLPGNSAELSLVADQISNVTLHVSVNNLAGAR